jgi:hypothetical protein
LKRRRWNAKTVLDSDPRFFQRKHNRSQPAEHQIKLHAQGRCIRCGKDAGGFWHCEPCRLKIQDRRKMIRHRYRQKENEYMRKWRRTKNESRRISPAAIFTTLTCLALVFAHIHSKNEMDVCQAQSDPVARSWAWTFSFSF